MWFGKIIAGFIGFSTAGIFGLIIGIIIGHSFDRAFKGLINPLSEQERQTIEKVFFNTVFLLMGRLAKADGQVSEQEVAHTEQLMSKMGLHSSHRQQAIELFQEGAKTEFALNEQLRTFKKHCSRHPNLLQQLINYLLSLALADGVLSPEEEAFLREVAVGIGIAPRMFEQLLSMIKAQAHFRGDGQGHYYPGAGAGPSELATAYQALGVEKTVSGSELKKAYRKLMSQNHPDKLMGQGLPEDMIKLATERSQEIQTAYEMVSKHRKSQ